jgi:hypothetical protein
MELVVIDFNEIDNEDLMILHDALMALQPAQHDPGSKRLYMQLKNEVDRRRKQGLIKE